MQHPLKDFSTQTIELLMCQKDVTAPPIKFRLEALQISDQRKQEHSLYLDQNRFPVQFMDLYVLTAEATRFRVPLCVVLSKQGGCG
jgi:hypothetical protein